MQIAGILFALSFTIYSDRLCSAGQSKIYISPFTVQPRPSTDSNEDALFCRENGSQKTKKKHDEKGEGVGIVEKQVFPRRSNYKPTTHRIK